MSQISEQTYHCLWDKYRPLLSLSTTQLRTYSGDRLEVMGTLEVKVSYNSQQVTLPLLVVKGAGPSLFGRDWLRKICVNWRLVNSVSKPQFSLEKVLSQYTELFSEGLGKLRGREVKLHLHPGAVPKFYIPQPVPFALRLLTKSLTGLKFWVSLGLLPPQNGQHPLSQ